MTEAALQAVGETGPGAEDFLTRLRCAQGHLKAIVNMVLRGASTEDVLAQLWSVEAALSAAGERMILAQLRAEGAALLRAGSSDDRAAPAERLARLLSLAMRHSPMSGR